MKSGRGRSAAWLSQVAAWFAIFAVAVVLALAVAVPRLAGATPYSVLTGSMRPSLPPGTLVVVKPVDIGEISAGDVITYQLDSGQPAVVTHRVETVGFRLDGTRSFITQGDANGIADAKPVIPVQIKGKLWYSVPYLGYVHNALSGRQRQAATYGVAGLLGLYSIYMFASALFGRRTHQQESGEENTS